MGDQIRGKERRRMSVFTMICYYFQEVEVGAYKTLRPTCGETTSRENCAKLESPDF